MSIEDTSFFAVALGCFFESLRGIITSTALGFDSHPSFRRWPRVSRRFDCRGWRFNLGLARENGDQNSLVSPENHSLILGILLQTHAERTAWQRARFTLTGRTALLIQDLVFSMSLNHEWISRHHTSAAHDGWAVPGVVFSGEGVQVQHLLVEAVSFLVSLFC